MTPPAEPLRGCSITGCKRAYHARGYCARHYADWRRNAPPESRLSPTKSERFWAKVDRSSGPDSCWPWTGAVNDHGYGVFSGGETRRAHRYAYLMEHGSMPKGEIDHTCHNGSGCALVDDCPHRRCCNPRHLEDVSHAENTRRGDARVTTRIYGPEVQSHCKHGHEFTEENTWRNKFGHRYCRTCARNYQRERRMRNA